MLQEFYVISGLKINVEKTKVSKLGKVGGSRNVICPELNLV